MRMAAFNRSMASGWISRARKALRSSSCWSFFFFAYWDSSSIFFISASEAICFRSCGFRSIEFAIALPRPRKYQPIASTSCVLGASWAVHHCLGRFRLALVASAFARGVAPQGGLEHALDLAQALLGDAAADPHDVDHFPQTGTYARGEVGFALEHVRYGLYGSAFVQQQHEKLFAHQLFEVGQRHALTRFFPHPAQEVEATLIGHALRSADVKQSPYQGLTRAAGGNAFPELTYAACNPGAAERVFAGPVSPELVRCLEPSESLEGPCAIYGVKGDLVAVIAHVPVVIERGFDQVREPCLGLPERILMCDGMPVLADVSNHWLELAHEGICARDYFVLYPRRVQLAHPFRRDFVRPHLNPRMSPM